MLSTEERSGLAFTLIGGGVLAVALLVWIGFFSEPATAPKRDAVARAGTPPALRLGAARGRVVDARSGFGLAARVVDVRGLDGLSDHWLLEADPATPGAFEVRGLPSGRSCTLALSADGYVDATRECDVVAGRTLELGDVALTPLVTLIGQVVDAGGLSIGPAQVELVHDGGLLRADADLHGSFRFERLAPGRFALRARTETGDRSFLETRVDATTGGEQRGLQVEVFPTVALRGAFRLPVGSAPLVGVAAQSQRGQVAGDGRFEVTGLRAGPLRLVVLVNERDGVALELAAPADELDLPIDPAAAVELAALPADDDSELARLVAPEPAIAGEPRGSLVVRALGPQGERLAGARVELAAADPAIAPRLRFTSRAGECVARGLRAGIEWRVTVRSGPLAATSAATVEPEATRELVLNLTPEPSPLPPADER